MSDLPRTPISRAQAEDLLYHEAALIDGWQLEEWLALFTGNARPTYWVAGPDGGIDPRRQTSIVYDDANRLEERVWRLVEGPAHAQIPRSVTSRIVGNVTVADTRADAALVRSRFLLHEVRKDQRRSFAGAYEHDLVRVDDDWRIDRKKVLLADGNEPIFNLSFIL